MTVLGNLNPKMMSAIAWTPKGTSLRHNACFELLCVKIHRRVTSVRRVGEKIKIKKERPYISHISPDVPLRPIGTNFGLRVRLVDVINTELCADDWWSAAALGGLMTGGGGVGGVKPNERTLKQRTRWTGVFPGFTGVSHFTCDICWAAGAETLTVNMHAVHNFTVVMS